MTRLMDAILRHSLDRPDAIAIDGAEARLSWAELARLLPDLDKDLAGGPGNVGAPVAIALDHGVAACLVDLALAEARIPSLPLPPFFTAEQVSHATQAAGSAALIRAGAADCASALERRLDVTLEPLTHSPAGVPGGTGRISLTSGSTGTPKGICLSIDHLIDVAEAVVTAVRAEHPGRHLPVLQPGILLEGVAGFYATLLAGGTYVARPQAEIGLADPFRPDMDRLVATVEREAITSLILVPEYLAGLVAALETSGKRLPRLTLVAVGGAGVPPALVDRARAVGLPVRQGYGLTECGSVIALERGDEPEPGSVGTSLGLHRIRVEQDGEILVEGPLHLGTIGEPRPDGPLRTGDIGRLDGDGRLWIEGRKFVTHAGHMRRWRFAGTGTHRLFDADSLRTTLDRGGLVQVCVEEVPLPAGIRGLLATAERP